MRIAYAWHGNRQPNRAERSESDQDLSLCRRRNRGAPRLEPEGSGGGGSGKSTLLHLIAGLDRADGGEAWLADTSLSELSDAGRAALRRDRLGLVFQQFNLIPSLRGEDNLVFQARIAGRHDPDWHRELVERLGLSNFLKRYPEQLSGGPPHDARVRRAVAHQ